MFKFFRRERKTRQNIRSRAIKIGVFALIFGGAFAILSATFAANTPLANDVRVDVNSELRYFLTVKEDGVDASGVRSSDSTRAEITGSRITVTDKIPDGLIFKGFVTTSDGTFGAVSRANKSTSCPGKIIDDTKETSKTSGSWNAAKTEYTYHGLHYNANTRTVNFIAEDIQAGCELTVGIITTTPSTIDDPTTSAVETRRDFFNTAYATEKSVTASSNTVHVFMGDSIADLYNVSYAYSGYIPAGAPAAPSMQKYAAGAKVIVSDSPVLEGYTFSGWTPTGASVAPGSFNMPSRNVSIIGSWTKKEESAQYTVTYVINGADKPSDYMPPKTRSYTADTSIDLDSTKVGDVIDGYKFLGWTTSDVTLSETGFNMPSKNVTISGSFERIGYTVCYEFMNQPQPSNAAQLTPACKKYYPGDEVTTAAAPTAAGYKFTGWYAKSKFTMPEEDVVIQGEWVLQAGTFAPQISKTIVNAKTSYYYGDTVDFKITVKNTASYAIKNVFVEEQLEGANFINSKDGSYTVKGGTTAVIANIAAGASVDVYASYKVTQNKTATFTNKVELTGATADGNNNLDTSKDYTATATFKTIPEPVTPTGIIINSLPYVGIGAFSILTIFAFVFISKQEKSRRITKSFAMRVSAIGKVIASNKFKIAIPSIVLVAVILGGMVAKTVFAATHASVVSSIKLTSKNSSYANGVGGSWDIDKTAEWTGAGTARITFDVKTIAKIHPNVNLDVVLVLDNSGSMEGDKLRRVKEDSISLVQSILSDTNNRVGLVNFHTTATKLSNLTNNKQSLVSSINSLEPEGTTNYYDALVKAEEILQGYQKQANRELILLFLTDGYPNQDTPNEIAQYEALKKMYPFMIVNGIQYEMGVEVLDPIIAISDNQYIADINTLKNILLEASIPAYKYDRFVLTDYINNTYWQIDSIKSISQSAGDVTLKYEGNTPVITWDLGDNFLSGSSAKMTIDVSLKDANHAPENTLLPTNTKETVTTKIPDTPDENITSQSSPVLKTTSDVTYEANLPATCTVYSGYLPLKRTYRQMAIVEISDNKISCNGYNFNGWAIASGDNEHINDGYFRIFGEDVVLRATWTKVSIEKSMEGTVKEEAVAQLSSGTTINSTFKRLAGQTNTSYSDRNDNIRAIEKATTMSASQQSSAEKISLASSAVPVYAWFANNTIYIYTTADRVVMNPASYSTFNNLRALETVNAITDWDASRVTNISNLFAYAEKLTSIAPLANWNVSNVSQMQSVFMYNWGLKSLAPLSKWNTSNVISMTNMFYDCQYLTSLTGIENFDTSKVTNMDRIFYNTRNNTSLAPLKNWNTGNVTSLFGAFGMYDRNESHALTSLSGLENWNTSKVTNMRDIFISNSSLTTAKALAKWDTSSVTDMGDIFFGDAKMTTLEGLENWNTSKVTKMDNAFYDLKLVPSLAPLSKWNVSSVETFEGTFHNLASVTTLDPIANWVTTSKLTNIRWAFAGMNKLKSVSALSKMNTSNVVNMDSAFFGDEKIATLEGLENWNTSKVTNMVNLFYNLKLVPSLAPLSKWDVSSVETFEGTFHSLESVTTLDPLASWRTTSATNMAWMFAEMINLKSVSGIAKLDTSKVKAMNSIFVNEWSVETFAPIAGWNVSNVENMKEAFHNVDVSKHPAWYRP
ncbi:MAG: BspA family leucine-rich repeat surface protein [Candidatus Saccharibacteria bacterium]|nr:BspA family leucine-rich repeat surface protein [Candidatus Saccharibacteria bacterium]